MGAVLAALLSSQFPTARLVLLAPAFQFTNKLLPWSWLIGPFVERIRWQVTAQQEISDNDNAVLSREYWQWRYPRQGTAYLRLRRMAIRALGRVTAETLIIIGMQDKSVPSTVVSYIEKRMTSARTRYARYANASHMLFTGPEEGEIYCDVSRWLRQQPKTLSFG
jgi:carboxylesterase